MVVIEHGWQLEHATRHIKHIVWSRVDEGGRVSNHAYTDGEHYWESNVTLT